VFDIVDVKQDDIHLQTVPQKIGVEPTKKLGYVLLLLLLISEFFYTNNHHFLPFFFKLLVCYNKNTVFPIGRIGKKHND
jgi:hypothetical protein